MGDDKEPLYCAGTEGGGQWGGDQEGLQVPGQEVPPWQKQWGWGRGKVQGNRCSLWGPEESRQVFTGDGQGFVQAIKSVCGGGGGLACPWKMLENA